jgi:hypothetical protein
MCTKTIVLVPEEDPNVTWERHVTAGECDPTAVDRRKKKRRCAADGCRERLTLTNAHTCSSCGVEVCLRLVHFEAPTHSRVRVRTRHSLALSLALNSPLTHAH